MNCLEEAELVATCSNRLQDRDATRSTRHTHGVTEVNHGQCLRDDVLKLAKYALKAKHCDALHSS